MLEKNHIIYMHRNKQNNKVYIGQTKQTLGHRSSGGKNYEGCTKFYAAIQKYGWDNFEHNIIEKNLTSEEADEREIYWIKYYNSIEQGYNISPGGECHNRIFSEETRKKMSQARQGEKHPNFGKETPIKVRRRIGMGQHQNQIIECVETGQRFFTITEAAKSCSRSRSSMADCLYGRTKSCGKDQNNQSLHWKFVSITDQEEELLK